MQRKKYDVGGLLLDRPFKIRRLGDFGFGATGTCLGVGRPRGLFLQQGDEVVLTIGNLGTLRTPIIRDNEP